MADRLPIIPVGPHNESPEHQRLLVEAVQDIIGRFNQVESAQWLDVVTSVVVTLCCNQRDPVATFVIIGEAVGRGTKAVFDQPTAGTG